MQANSKTLLEQIHESAPNVNPASIASSLYRRGLESAIIASAHEASYSLLDTFNAFCAEHGVNYFAIADTLAGTYSYDDFIPGTTKIEVGMLRDDYLRFEHAYYEAGGHNVVEYPYPSPADVLSFSRQSLIDALADMTPNDDVVADLDDVKGVSMLDTAKARIMSAIHPDQSEEGEEPSIAPLEVRDGEHLRFFQNEPSETPFTLSSHYDLALSYHKRMPTVQMPGYFMVMREGNPLFGAGHMPIVYGPTIQISVFDALPDDYDFARALFKELKTLSNLGKKAAGAPKLAASLRDHEWKLAGSYNAEPHREVARLTPTRSQSIPVQAVASTKPHAFGPTTIMCPDKGDVWVVEDVQKQTEQVKILQSDAAAIIKEIDRICRANDIGYFVCGGTMLGYVRHGGFIPWDDDMDIGMLRADYERFLEVAAREIDSERFFLQTRESDPNIPYLFSKVRMKNSEYVTKYNQFRDFDKGICVDVFPFDRVPFETGELPAFRKVVRQVTRAHNKIANRQVGAMPSTQAKTLRQKLAREVMSIRHDWYWTKSLAKTQKDYEDTVTQFNDVEDFHYVASHVPTFTMVHLDDLLPYQDVDFDGMTLKCPAKPEVFLQMQYGDFMTMPQPHQQRGHALIWWSDPDRNCAEFGTERPDHAATAHHDSKVLTYGVPGAAVAAAGIAALAVGKLVRGR